jgi:peptide/nickel transport system permease protein
VPDFWLALLMLVAFAYWIPVFPIGGAIDPVMHESMSASGRIADRAAHLALPAITLSLLYFPLIARYQRAALLDVMPADFVATARAKGVPEPRVVTRHALRNALLPVITLLGIAFPALLTGAVFIEKVFSWPGMGLVVVNSIQSRDYPLLTGCVLLGSVFVVIGSILADLLYRWVDPRTRDEL